MPTFKKISQLPPTPTVLGTHAFEINNLGVSQSVSLTRILNFIINNSAKTVETVVSAGGILVIDLSVPSHKQITLFEDVAVSFINVPLTNQKIDFDFIVTQDGTGDWKMTFAPTPENDQPTINPTANETTILNLFTYNQLASLFIELSLQPIVVQVGNTTPIVLTNVLANILTIDKRRYRKLVVVIQGDDTEVVEYQVFGTSKTIAGAAGIQYYSFGQDGLKDFSAARGSIVGLKRAKIQRHFAICFQQTGLPMTATISVDGTTITAASLVIASGIFVVVEVAEHIDEEIGETSLIRGMHIFSLGGGFFLYGGNLSIEVLDR